MFLLPPVGGRGFGKFCCHLRCDKAVPTANFQLPLPIDAGTALTCTATARGKSCEGRDALLDAVYDRRREVPLGGFPSHRSVRSVRTAPAAYPRPEAPPATPRELTHFHNLHHNHHPPSPRVCLAPPIASRWSSVFGNPRSIHQVVASSSRPQSLPAHPSQHHTRPPWRPRARGPGPNPRTTGPSARLPSKLSTPRIRSRRRRSAGAQRTARRRTQPSASTCRCRPLRPAASSRRTRPWISTTRSTPLRDGPT
jgi:hypothetical protein